jgi:hypothetical protein
MLAYVAGRDVELDADELSAARRRAVLLLAAGGDPHRDLELDGRAVTALAADLAADTPRAQLAAGLDALDAHGLPRTTAALDRLRSDPELAWRAYAAALVAEELGE